MSVYLRDPDVTLYHGDALDVLRELPDESVDCAATSPPFYGLRDYGTGRWEGGDEGCDHRHPSKGISKTTLGTGSGGNAMSQEARDRFDEGQRPPYASTCGKCGARRIDQQIGLEATPEEWRDRLVEVFRELRRVLVSTGTLWVECGDSYNAHPGGGGDRGGRSINATQGTGNQPQYQAGHGLGRVKGLKPKDLIGAPFLLAFGLRDDGWWWRSTNIWHKPNCLPESVTDRPVVSHSYVFQFSKKARYFHDAEAVREPAEWARWGDQTVVKEQQGKGSWIPERSKADLQRGRTWEERKADGAPMRHGLDGASFHGDGGFATSPAGRSLRSVWTIPTQGFPEAHFATWPTKLAERILLMACPESVCRVCGKARERVTESMLVKRKGVHNSTAPTGALGSQGANRSRDGHRAGHREVVTLGYTDCGHNAYRPGVVLDPFVGSGTTCHVARKLDRRSIGIDLNPEYLALAAKRLAQQSLLAVEA